LKFRHNLAFVLTCLLAFVSIADAAEDKEYRLGAGDRVNVIVYGHKDLSGEFEVDSTGRLSLPLIQVVRAAGLTEQELEEAITRKLKPDYLLNPRVSVDILTYRPFYILGEVKKPGSYPYESGMTIVNAVALGGGYTYRAKKEGVTIIRASDPDRKKIPANHGTKIFPGDIIEVPERFF
jgi:protein involved in polysaccharide export with SLBB domain